MERLRSQLRFTKQQRVGIFSLVVLITGLLCIYHYISFSEEPILDISSSEIVALSRQIDSLRLAEIETRKPKIYPFNPNFITDFRAYTLGMTAEEINRLKKYRAEGKWINSSEDFKKVTKVSDSLLKRISPHFKFPDWVTNPKPRNEYIKKGFSEKSYAQKTDLNLATETQLQEIRGIGETFSKRIISYREKLRGFTSDIQLYQVYGLEKQIVSRILNEFTVKTPKEIIRLDINNVSASDIATIPGISFDLAKKVWEFRVLRGRIEDFSELKKIEGISPILLDVIQLYLQIE